MNTRHIKCNNYDLGPEHYKKDEVSTMAIFPEFNALYGWCLMQPLPYANFRYLSDSEIAKYRNNPRLFLEFDKDDNSEIGMYVTVDYNIPEDLALMTDCMPLSIIKTSHIKPSPYTSSVGGDRATQEKLIAGHFPLKKYSFHIRLLKLYITLGVIITHIHSIIEFRQKPIFADYIMHCSRERQKAVKNKNSVLKHFYKLLPNSLYGKSLQNELNFDTVSVICQAGRRYQKLCSNYKFRSRKWLVAGKIALVTLTRDKLPLKSPIYVGSSVLQLAKLKNLSFFISGCKT